ncbi:MAG: hypothetical protein J1F13_01990 [Prevotellaceae bacterium]|nr:hypothetical protein [Prevotellaceae bacterium]
MKKFSFLKAMCAGLLVMGFASCASYQKEAAIMSIGGNSINTYVAADIDYANAKQVAGSINTRTVLWFIQLERNGNKTLKSVNRYRNLSKTEAQALYRAKQDGDVDIILEPEFDTEKHSWFFGIYKTSKTQVKGWGVNIKGLKEDTHGVLNPQRDFNRPLF